MEVLVTAMLLASALWAVRARAERRPIRALAVVRRTRDYRP